MLSCVLALFLGCGGESARSGHQAVAGGGRAPSAGTSGQGPAASVGGGSGRGPIAGAGGSSGTSSIAGAWGGTSLTAGGSGTGAGGGLAGTGGTDSDAGGFGGYVLIFSGGAPNVPPMNLCPREYPNGDACTALDRDGCAYDPDTSCQCTAYNGDICIKVVDGCSGSAGAAGESSAAGAAGSFPADATLMLCDCDADMRWSCAEYDV